MMSVSHPNFYENLQEARLRLRSTVVLYDGEPYQIIGITDHKGDGIFRVYLDAIGHDAEKHRHPNPYDIWGNYPHDHPSLGEMFDKWMEANPKSGVLRKQMNSPLFNKFRPFPLGMCDVGKHTYFVERQPNRKTEQGLVRSMLYENLISTGAIEQFRGLGNINLYGKEFRDTIMGKYPSPEICLTELLDPNTENYSHGFHRNFALARGPIDMLFLAYKSDIVGVLTNSNFGVLKLGKKFGHTREAIADLQLFTNIL